MAACPTCGTESPETAKFCAECGERLRPAVAPERFRRNVTILFSDVVGSTALGERLDPETLARVMGDYFAAVKPAVERHGGTLAKFIGDAVMAVFGLVELHEDDALRAVRAALEMRQTLAVLNPELEQRYGVALTTRTGINTGLVAGEGLMPDRNFVAGDTANTAARLQTAAGDDEILLGRGTYRLVRDAVEAELLPSLQAKGKEAPLTAYRLLALAPETELVAGRSRTPLVGRQRELAELAREFARCRQERSCRLVTLVGAPGVGKSRLVREFVARAGEEAVVLEGRCLPYGEGITYWPLGQMVRQAAAIEETDSVDEAVAKLAALAGDADVAERVAHVIGLRETGPTAEETPWAVQRLLAAAAATRPLVCVCDDLQWAEPALLGLLRELAARSRESPILLCCLARPDLLELEPDWPGVIAVDALSEGDGELLLSRLLAGAVLPAGARDRITAAAAGNPLFIEQFAAMLADEALFEPDAAADALPVPPTLQALLHARLERLEPGERHVLSRASVAGQIFDRSALAELVSEALRPRLDAILLELMRRDFLLPTRSDLGSEDALQFRHLLIRDTAYEALTKEDRADLHERFGRWLEQSLAVRPDETEEIVGYHLEQAHRLCGELRPRDERDRRLADEAAQRLASAGRRAARRGDSGAAANLLARAAALLPVGDERRPRLLVEVGFQLHTLGRYEDARGALAEAVARETDECVAALAELARLRIELACDPGADLGALEAEAGRALELYETTGDDTVATAAWDVLADVSWIRCRFAEAADAGSRAAEHAERAGDSTRTSGLMVGNFNCATSGPMPTSLAIALGEEILEALRRQPAQASGVLSSLGHLHAMRGEFEVARGLVIRALATREEGGVLTHAGRAESLGWEVEARSGNWEAAEREIRAACDALAALGDAGFLSTAAAMLAHCLWRLGRVEEAEEYVAVSAATAASDDLSSQVLVRRARARVLSARGELPQAVAVAREAADLLVETDGLAQQGDTLLELAELLALAGRHEDAVAAARRALAAYEAKEHLVGAGRASALLEELTTPAAGVRA